MILRVPEAVYRRRLERMKFMIETGAPAILIWTEARLIRVSHYDPFSFGAKLRKFFTTGVWGY